jgi:hypothetical protein
VRTFVMNGIEGAWLDDDEKRRMRSASERELGLCPGERLLGLEGVAHHRTAMEQFAHDARCAVRVVGDGVPPRACWSGVVAAEEAHEPSRLRTRVRVGKRAGPADEHRAPVR